MTRKPATAALLSALLLSAGCTLIPDYAKPLFSAAPEWHAVPGYESPAGKQAAHQLSWEVFFDSPELRNLIQTALDNNKDLRLAALNIEAARANYRIERADLMPNFNATGTGTYQQSTDEASGTAVAQKVELYQAGVGLSSYEIDLFGRIRSQNKAAVNEYLATREARNVVQQALIGEVANGYLQYLADRKLLSLTEKTLEAQEQTQNILKESRKNGLSTDQDVARATTAVETARVNLHQYRRYVEQDKNALIQLLGVPHDDTLIPDLTLDDIQLAETLDPRLPAEVLLARPDIRQAEYELLARNASIGAARAAFFPRITLTGSYGYASAGLTKLFTAGAADAYNFVPQIVLPIFQGGRNKANLDLAEIRKDQAIISYEQAIQNAFREVSDELAARATLDEQLKAQRRLVAAAQKVYDLSQARYKSGIDSFLSVLDSQRELYTYQQNEIQIERQRLANLVTLYKVLGGGTSPAN